MNVSHLEKITKIVLSTAVVGIACKIALERHRSHMAFRKKVGELMTSIGPHEYDSDKGRMARFCMNLVKRP